MGVEEDNTALLPGVLIQLLFPAEVGNLCIQGQEEVGEKILQCGGAVYGERERESAARASTGDLEKQTGCTYTRVSLTREGCRSKYNLGWKRSWEISVPVWYPSQGQP